MLLLIPPISKSILFKFLGVLAELFKRIKENVKRSDFWGKMVGKEFYLIPIEPDIFPKYLKLPI